MSGKMDEGPTKVRLLFVVDNILLIARFTFILVAGADILGICSKTGQVMETATWDMV